MDRLASGRSYALLGQPVAHSRSPALYRALFTWAGIEARYGVMAVAPPDGQGILDAIRAAGLAGANLTAPLKERVIPALDALSPEAAAAGAVNVVVREDGRWVGHNTDGSGLIAALSSLEAKVRGRKVVVLGAGGTGRGVAEALRRAGVASLVLLNRTEARAQIAAASLGTEAGPLRSDAFSRLARGAELVINCTAGAAAAAVQALDVSVLAPDAAWVDVNYWMSDPPQADACRAAGLAFHTGHEMLLYQGLFAFLLFTDVIAPPEVGAAAIGDR